MVELSEKRYKQLIHAEEFLAALRAAGVDNWEGYCEAVRAMDEEEAED